MRVLYLSDWRGQSSGWQVEDVLRNALPDQKHAALICKIVAVVAHLKRHQVNKHRASSNCLLMHQIVVLHSKSGTNRIQKRSEFCGRFCGCAQNEFLVWTAVRSALCWIFKDAATKKISVFENKEKEENQNEILLPLLSATKHDATVPNSFKMKAQQRLGQLHSTKHHQHNKTKQTSSRTGEITCLAMPWLRS